MSDAATPKAPGDLAHRAPLTDDLDSTFVVEAAAGTGKTTVLVGRIVRVVQTGRARLSQCIAVTFTERAAGEMKLRLRAELERAREATAAPDERGRLTQALEELEVARIGTIHGLCADFLREYPVEARVDPLFEVAAEDESDAILHTAFQREFQELLRHPPEGVRRLLRRRARGEDDEPPRQTLLGAVKSLIEHRDFTAPWRRDPFDRDARLDEVVARLEAFAELVGRASLSPRRKSVPWGWDTLQEVRRFVADLHHREAVAPRDHDGLEAQLRALSRLRNWDGKLFGLDYDGTSEQALLDARQAVVAALTGLVGAAEADLAACLHAELWPVVRAYELEKGRRGVLDFVDLLLKTRDLVRDVPAVRAELQRRFTHLFVDEFQDTDPLQSELVLLLAADDPAQSRPFDTRCVPGKLFVVGDPKQSIYRFRRADVALYERVKQHLLGHGARLALLSTSFRSTPGIQAAINACFEPVMRGQTGGQATYVPLGAHRDPYERQPSLVALPAAAPFGVNDRPTKAAMESSTPKTVAAFLAWLLRESGWTVAERGARVPIEPRHVCILFKKFRGWGGADVPRPYAQALEAHRLPHVLVGGRSFHQREEIMALRTALAAIERPDDELSVYATLRGPFFAFPDAALLAFKHEVGRLHPLRPLDRAGLTEASAPVADALAVVRRLHLRRNRQGAASTLNELLEATRAHAGLAFWSAGRQALANVLQLAEVTRRAQTRTTSFRDLVELLDEEAAQGEAPDAPLVEEGTDGVRMMTVHAAKGLEFPVVVLADPTANASRGDPSHYVDPERGLWAHALAHCVPAELREHAVEVLERDQEEAVRVTYVAATRAKDLLVVPVCSERRWTETWLSVLEPAVWPGPESLKSPRPAPGCPPLGHDVLVDRLGSVPPDAPLPGLHRAETKKNGVVWWSATALRVDVEERTGLENDDALKDAPLVAPAAREAYERWRDERTQGHQQGATPAQVVKVARELLERPEGVEVPLVSTDVGRAGRPGGRRFGELVHAALAQVPFDADRAGVERVVGVHARALLATEPERVAAVVAVVAALRHPLFDHVRAALEVRREDPVVDLLPDGTVMEGTIDLAYRSDEGWTVVELKTDDDLAAHRPAYEAQTAAYVRAIGMATGEPARGLLFQV